MIGSYEPLVLLAAGSARETSVAAEPDIHDAPGEHYHRNCYTAGPSAAPAPRRSPTSRAGSQDAVTPI